jgi:outer membrane immunogenic protein
MISFARTLALATALVGLGIPAASAADFWGGNSGLGSVLPSPYFNFEGFYLGGTLGAGSLGDSGTFGTVGIVAGNNFDVNDAIIAGAELQADLLYNGNGLIGFDTLLLAKLGGYVTENAVLYGAAGAGWVDSHFAYAFGGGAEFAMTDQLSVRGELLGLGEFGSGPGGAKATAGLLWHIR